GQRIRCHSTWTTPVAASDDYGTASREVTFLKGVGLPGRVWASAKPEWISDVTQDQNFPRAALAERVGFHSAAAFPVKQNGHVHAVLEFYRHEVIPVDPALMITFQAVADQLSQFCVRARVEDQLRRTQFAMDQAMDAVYWIDAQARIVYVNEAAVRMLGYSRAELLALTVHDLNPTFPPATWSDFWAESRQRGTWAFESDHRAKDGRMVPVELQVSFLAHDGREFHCAFVRDITERKRREAALLNIVQGVTAASGTAFFESVATHLAAALGADYAFIGELLEGQTDRIHTLAVCADGQRADNFEYDLAHTPCQQVVGQHLCTHVRGVQRHFPQDRLLVELGIEGYAGTPLRDAAGHVVGIMATLYRQPIPNPALVESMLQIFAVRAAAELERQHDDQALRASEEKLRQSLLASNTGLWEWHTETNAVRFSREWKQQLGYDEAELPNTFESWASRLHPDDHDQALAYAQQYRDHPVGMFRQDFRLRHKDGTYRWIDSHASFVTEPDGRRVRLLGSHIDITERKQVERLLALQHLVANVLATASGLDHAISDILQPVCETLGWDEGLLWMVDESAKTLRCHSNWSALGVAMDIYGAASREFIFPCGVGLPGRVWEGAKPVWISDV
ncbi:MAG: PAS domain S-box protein, partial [Nitrospira sp.]|nr:PAS domain S-box protein [Nitrospira sp.]